MHVTQFSLVTFSYPHRLPYIDGQTKGVRANGSKISNLRSQYLLRRSGLRSGEVGIHNDRVQGGPQLIQWRRILLQASSIQRFLSSKIGLKLFHATHAHGLSNNQVIKWYLRLELRGRCMLLRFLSTSSHLHIFYPIFIANQTKFELVGAQFQTLRAQTSSSLKEDSAWGRL